MTVSFEGFGVDQVKISDLLQMIEDEYGEDLAEKIELRLRRKEIKIYEIDPIGE